MLVAWAIPAVTGTTTTGIVTSTMDAAPACMEWRPSGVCFWLVCSPFGCKVRTSLRVSNYAPDLVVSVFHDSSTHPWTDFGRRVATRSVRIASLLLPIPVDSAGTRTRDDHRERNTPYRDADGIGHPVAGTNLLSSFGLVCSPASVNPFLPYFQSYADALVWRAVVPIEMLFPQSLIPGAREIGSWPANTWGNVYPRDGRITQPNEVKAAAVIAQRVGDVVTRLGQPHVYTPIGSGGMANRSGMLYWLPPPLVESKPSTGKWQMLSPLPEPSCHAFGENDSILHASYGDGRVDDQGAYAFNLWRPYSCCPIRGVFIGATTF
jgi:integrating conjugative element protein (TIGR03756 family)